MPGGTLLVVGSVALDTVQTPAERREEVLGGSATYFAYAASFFCPVRLVGVVGDDFPPACRQVLSERDIELAGLVTRPGRTFRWTGRYAEGMNERETVAVELNVFGEHTPEVPEAFRDSAYVFLANCRPAAQAAVLDRMTAPRLVVADTMNLWIDTRRSELLDLIGRVGGLVLNDEEARLLTGRRSLVGAAREIGRMGPGFVVIKKGEHGVLVADEAGVAALPACPVEDVRDPTGAGDSFAGGMMGYLARTGETREVRKAVAHGTVLASYCVEDFSLDRLRRLTLKEIERRLSDYRAMLAV